MSVRTDVDREDVVSVEGLLSVLMLRTHCGLLASIEPLLAGVSVHDDAQSGNHVDSFALGSVPQVLLAICCAIAIDMLDLKLGLGRLLVCLLRSEIVKRESD